MEQLLLDLEPRYHFVEVHLEQTDSTGKTWQWWHILDEKDVRLCAQDMRAKGCTVAICERRGRKN